MLLFSTELELRLIRTLCQRGSYPQRLAGRVRESLFHTRAARRGFAMITDSLKEGRDPPRWENLRLDPRLATELRKELTAFGGKAIDEDEADEVLRNLKGYSDMRLLAHSAKDILDAAGADDMDVPALADALTDRLARIRSGAAGSEPAVWNFGEASGDGVVREVLESDGVQGVPTTFRTWDRVNGKIPETAVMLLAATTGGGKSLMAANMVRNMAWRGLRPMILSLEMSRHELAARLVSSVAGIPLQKVMQGRKGLTDREHRKARVTYGRWRNTVRERGGSYSLLEMPDAPDMTAALQTMKARSPDCILIDYIALLDGVGGDNDWRKLAEAVREAKRFSMANRIPCVILAQLSDNMVLLYSKRMQHHADIMWSWAVTKESRDEGVIQIEQHKSRNLNPFPFRLAVDWEHALITDMDDGAVGDGVRGDGDAGNDGNGTADNGSAGGPGKRTAGKRRGGKGAVASGRKADRGPALLDDKDGIHPEKW